MTPFAKIQDGYLGAWNRPLDVKEQLQVFLSSRLRVHQALTSCSRNTWRGCCIRGNGLGRRLTTRGSYRPGRAGLRSRARSLTIAWYANSHILIRVLRLSPAHHSPKRISADLKLTCSSRTSPTWAASNMTVRIRL